MTFTLGYKPEKFKVEVSPDSDFFASLTREDDTDWPAGSEVSLDFGNGIDPWVADLSGPTASWVEDEAVVNEVIAAKPKKVKLWYAEGETKMVWGIGALAVEK